MYFRYGSEEPKNSDLLLKRRNLVLRRMKASSTKDKPVSPQQIQEVDDAYEYLKAILDGNFETLRQVNNPLYVLCQRCVCHCVKSLLTYQLNSLNGWLCLINSFCNIHSLLLGIRKKGNVLIIIILLKQTNLMLFRYEKM